MQLDWKAIGKRIKELRERREYTREEMADKIGKSVTFCRDMEFGKSMSVTTLADICELFDAPTDYILFGKDIISDSQLGEILSSCDERERDMFGSIVREFTRIYTPKRK